MPAYSKFMILDSSNDKWIPACLLCGINSPANKFESHNYDKFVEHLLKHSDKDLRALGFKKEVL